MGYDQRQNSDDWQVVDVGEQALSRLFSWRKKVLCISRDWPTLLQPPPPNLLLQGGRRSNLRKLLNYAPAETGVLQFFFQGRPAE